MNIKNQIPLVFNHDENEEIDNLTNLKHRDDKNGYFVSWEIAGVNFFVPNHKYHIDWNDIRAANGSTVKFHELSGFSIGRYHEFLITEINTPAAFIMGNIEVTFGDATPLMKFMFDPLHYEKYYGDWSYISTMRIFNTDQENLEISIANALMHYSINFKHLPELWSMDFDQSEITLEDENEVEKNIYCKPLPVGDLAPLRFLYQGLSQNDDTAACLSYYRIIEYYSFLIDRNKISKLRQDEAINNADFIAKILGIINKNEKELILRLIKDISSSAILEIARDLKLIEKPESQELGIKLYSYRNSIVHGKESNNYALLSTPIIDKNKESSGWRKILRDLSLIAIENYGTRIS